MDIFQAIILSVVEGVTEFLPVSSTGHMIIVSHLMGMPQTEFLKTFEIAIQLGAIGAVFSLYWRVFLLDWEVGAKVMAAFVPTAIVGFVLYKSVKHFLMGNLMVTAGALLIGGIMLVAFELWHKGKPEKVKELKDITYPQALIIGLCQSVAVIPGVSRSAATIIGGLTLGIGRTTIVTFSFLLAVPTMLAATVLDIAKSSAEITLADLLPLGVGFIVAFATAWLTVKFLLKYVQRHDFIAFGIYRIIAGIVIIWLAARL